MILTEEEEKIYKSYKPPEGWGEVFPSSPMNWGIYDVKDKDGNQIEGSRMIVFENGFGHCLIKRAKVSA
ncbi:MAG: hypothetical protein HYS25_01100 [Ignavibacteriales bacterium]|nr:hypothetical protein [Ignavibacteriales bacterium]